MSELVAFVRAANGQVTNRMSLQLCDEVERLAETLVLIERLSESPSWDDPSAGVGPIARKALADSNWCKRP